MGLASSSNMGGSCSLRARDSVTPLPFGFHGMYQCPVAAITNSHKFCGLKQWKLVLSQFWTVGVENQGASTLLNLPGVGAGLEFRKLLAHRASRSLPVREALSRPGTWVHCHLLLTAGSLALSGSGV